MKSLTTLGLKMSFEFEYHFYVKSYRGKQYIDKQTSDKQMVKFIHATQLNLLIQ